MPYDSGYKMKPKTRTKKSGAKSSRSAQGKKVTPRKRMAMGFGRKK